MWRNPRHAFVYMKTYICSEDAISKALKVPWHGRNDFALAAICTNSGCKIQLLTLRSTITQWIISLSLSLLLSLTQYCFVAYKYLVKTDVFICISKMLLVNEDHLSLSHTPLFACCASLPKWMFYIQMSQKQQPVPRCGLTWRKWILGCFGFIVVSELISALIYRP